MTTETIIEDPRWNAVGLAGLAETAAAAALVHLGLDPARIEIGLLGCDDARIANLNRDFRGKATPTNVLSWPVEDRAPATPGASPDLGYPDTGEPAELGDIAIAFDTCASEARLADRPLTDHVTHLLVHGVLHLLGYDHMTEQDAALMERLEVEILATMGLPDPY